MIRRVFVLCALTLWISIYISTQSKAQEIGSKQEINNCSYASGDHAVCDISVYALIANPSAHYGTEYFVIGYLAIDYGILKLWTDKDSFDHDIDANSIIIDIPYDKAVKLVKNNNKSYCAVIGVFSKAANKVAGMHSTNSVLTHVSRLSPVGVRIHSNLDSMILRRIGEG